MGMRWPRTRAAWFQPESAVNNRPSNRTPPPRPPTPHPLIEAPPSANAPSEDSEADEEDDEEVDEEDDEEDLDGLALRRVLANPNDQTVLDDVRAGYRILSVNMPSKTLIQHMFKAPDRDTSLFHTGLRDPWESVRRYRASYPGPLKLLRECHDTFGPINGEHYRLQVLHGCGSETERALTKRGNKYWFLVSELFAELSSGKVRVLLQGTTKLSKPIFRRSVFYEYELPALMRNEKVAEIIAVNCVTGEERVAHSRGPGVGPRHTLETWALDVIRRARPL